jgi:hypothetical protein
MPHYIITTRSGKEVEVTYPHNFDQFLKLIQSREWVAFDGTQTLVPTAIRTKHIEALEKVS